MMNFDLELSRVDFNHVFLFTFQVTVHLKELMHHAKAFQKALSNHSNGKIHVTSMKWSSISNSNSTSTES